MKDLVVSSAPFVHSKNDVNKMFITLALALIFPAIYGIVLFGINAFLIIVVSVLTSGVSEMIFNLFNKKKFYVDNFSFLDTGLILALSLPCTAPIYVVAFCAFVATFVIKMAFGGLGRNPFNPALVARCLAGVMVPALSAELYELNVMGEDFVSLTAGGENIITNLLVGQGTGGIGTTFTLLLIACFIVLVILGVVDAKITVFAVVGYFVTSLIAKVGLEDTMINMFSGSFLFVSIFMITDPNSSPNTLLGKLVYGLGFGVLSAIIWKTGLLGENTVFAVALFMNFFVPLMDKYFVLKPISVGGYRYARKN